MKGQLSLKIKVLTAETQEELDEAVRLYIAIMAQNGTTIVSINYGNLKEGKRKRVLFATITTYKK